MNRNVQMRVVGSTNEIGGEGPRDVISWAIGILFPLSFYPFLLTKLNYDYNRVTMMTKMENEQEHAYKG